MCFLKNRIRFLALVLTFCLPLGVVHAAAYTHSPSDLSAKVIGGKLTITDYNTIRETLENFYYDTQNNYLGIGVTAPSSELDVAGDVEISGLTTVMGGFADADVTVIALGEPTVGEALSGFSAESIVGALNELKTDSTQMSVLANGKIYVGNASNAATEVTPGGDVTMTNAGSFSLVNSAVTGQALTGYVVGVGWQSVIATDTILESIQKLQGNVNVNKTNTQTNVTNIQNNTDDINAIETLPENYMYVGDASNAISEVTVNSTVIGQLLTGFTSGSGTVTASDSILEAIQKLDGNITSFSQEWTESGGILAPTTATDDVAVDTDTFFVDVSANRVGIGTTAPTQELEVDGTTTSTALVLNSGTTINEFSVDGTLAGNSDDAVPTEQAVKTYVDGKVPAAIASGGSTRDVLQWNGTDWEATSTPTVDSITTPLMSLELQSTTFSNKKPTDTCGALGGGTTDYESGDMVYFWDTTAQESSVWMCSQTGASTYTWIALSIFHN